MQQIFLAQGVERVILQDSKAIILSKMQERQSILIFEMNNLYFREFLILNFKVTTIACDPNLVVILMFQECQQQKQTILYQANLKKSFTPISTVQIPASNLLLVEWCNNTVCALAFELEINLYNIQFKKVIKNIQTQINNVSLLKLNSNFDCILFQFSKENQNQSCKLMVTEKPSQSLQFEKSVSCIAQIDDEEQIFVLQQQEKNYKLIRINFDLELLVVSQIEQNQLEIVQNTIFTQMGYRKNYKDILLLDSLYNVTIYTMDKQYKLTKQKTISQVKQFIISISTNNIIYFDKNYNLITDEPIVNEFSQNINRTQLLSVSCKGKTFAVQGILSENKVQGTTGEILSQYQKEFELMQPSFLKVIKLQQKFCFIPLIDFRVLLLPEIDQYEYQKYIPNMEDYIATSGVQHHLNQFEIALKGDNPLLCEGSAASGKTSIIQYLAYLRKQPLKIMNLSSFTQISDFIGKIEILPGFKLEFQPGPFAQAVKDGFWLLLDEANLASDSILRVIEDVLELGYLTIFGNQINSHIDLTDGILTIRRHPNFKLFLTQNPATDSKFAASRNVFSESLMSQFIVLKFQSMTSKDMQNIVDSLISKKLTTTDISSQQKLSSLIMKIYEEIKINQLDDGLFTLRDILHIIDVISLSQDKEKIIQILPIQYCLKLIITQFLDIEKDLTNIYSLVQEFEKLGYSNLNFEKTQKERIQQYLKNTHKQPISYLSFYNYLFPMLTMCYKTKRAALIIGQQFCGKLSSIKLWLQQFNIQNYEFFELSSNTTNEDLFGKYQPDQDGFMFKEGPITRCFSEGKVLILTNIDAPDSALTESLNGILEKNFKQLIVQNKKYQRHKDFAIIALSSDPQELEKKFTPALKSSFLTMLQDFSITKQDINLLFESVGLPIEESFINKIFESLEINKQDATIRIQFNKIIRFLKPIREFIQFYTHSLNQQHDESKAVEQVKKCIQFYIALSKQDTKSLYSDSIKLPITFNEVSMIPEQSVGKKFVFTASRKRISDILALAVAAKVPLILQGSAGVGKTKVISMFSEACQIFQGTQFYYINMNQNTDINDLMGQYVSSFGENKKNFVFKKGPLYLGMEKGGIVLVDEVNLSDPSILNFLAAISKYPDEYLDPTSNSIIKLNTKFRIFFAQNPPQFIGRSQLPECLAAKVIILDVPNYTFKEVLEICQGITPCIKQGMEYFLTQIIKYPEDGDEKKLKINNTQFTLRQFIKFRNRLEKTQFQTKDNWQRILKLHQMILYPMNQQDEDQLVCEIIIQGSNIIVKIKNSDFNDAIQVILPLKKQIEERTRLKVQNLNQNQTIILGKIAFCYYCKENVLIEGETSSKTYLSKLFSEIVQFQNPNPFEIIYISNCTEYPDLVGNIESHNQESYQKYCQNLIQKIQTENFNCQQETIKTLNNLKNIWDMKEFFDEVINNMKTQFPFVERGITLFARFGGVVCLKNITLADQSVLEGLNALLEIEPKFIVNGRQIKLHQEFFVIALLNNTFGGQVSDALQSRLTRIQINSSEFLDQKNELAISCKKYIKTLIKNDENSVYNFVKVALDFLKTNKSSYFKSLSDRKFYQWISFLDLKINSSYVEKLTLGLQFVLLDTYHEDFLKLFTDQTAIENYKNAEIKFNQYLKQNNLTKSSRIIISPQTKKIMLRILSSFSTQYIPCLIGPPGVGKSAIAQEIANILKKKFCRVCCSDSLSVEDLFGSYAPVVSKDSSGFVFKEGYLATALKEKSLILFDEVNLASPEVLSTLQALFTPDEKLVKIKDFILNKEDCVFLCSMNPPSYQGRQELPLCISNLLCNVFIEQFGIDDILKIFQASYQKELIKLNQQGIDFNLVLQLHKQLAEQSSQDSSSNYDFNIRFLQNLLQLFNSKFLDQRNQIKGQELQQEHVIICLEIIYVQHFYKLNSSYILQTILNKFNISMEEWSKRTVLVEQNANSLQIKRLKAETFIPFLKFPIFSQISPQIANNSYALTLKNSQIIEKLLISLQSKKVILCQGETSSGKTSTIIKLANLLNQRFILLPINCDLEVDDLLGNFNIVQDNFEEIQKGLENIVQGKQQMIFEKKQKQINMKYLDGVLKICLKLGYWLILDNINLARSEIVERLNSLGEDQPCLHINEFGGDCQKIEPHENFRLICVQNPERAQSNTLSPAFYNRCLKINFNIDTVQDDQDILEILVRNGLGPQVYQQDTVILAQKFLKQINFMKEKIGIQIRQRQLVKIFQMVQENGFQKYDNIMEIAFGDHYKQCQQLTMFPAFDMPSTNNGDTVFKQLVFHSVRNFDEVALYQLKNLHEFFKKYLQQKNFETYEYFIDTFGKEIKLSFENVSQPFKDNYDIVASGKIKCKICSYDLEILPIHLSLSIRKKELQEFFMRIECIFLSEKFFAELVLNQDKKFIIQFKGNEKISSLNMLDLLIKADHKNLYSFFRDLYKIAQFECKMIIKQTKEIKFNFQQLEFTFPQMPSLKLQNIKSYLVIDDTNFQFDLYFDLIINNCFIGNVKKWQSSKGEIEINVQKICHIFKDFDFYKLLPYIDLTKQEKSTSFFDIEQKLISINLEFQELIFVFNTPFNLKLEKLESNIKLSDQFQIEGNIIGAFQIYNKEICSFNKSISKNNKGDMIQFEFQQIIIQRDIPNYLVEFFSQYYSRKNYFLKLLQKFEEKNISELNISTNGEFWKIDLQIQLEQKIKNIKIENIKLLINLDSQTQDFQFSFIIEYLNIKMKYEFDVDFKSISQKQNEIKMVAGFEVINFLALSEIFSSNIQKLDNELKNILGYKELKINQDKFNEKVEERKKQQLVNKSQWLKNFVNLFQENEKQRKQSRLKRKLDPVIVENNQLENYQILKGEQKINSIKEKGARTLGLEFQQTEIDLTPQDCYILWEQSLFCNLDLPISDWKLLKFLNLRQCIVQFLQKEQLLQVQIRGMIFLTDGPLIPFKLSLSDPFRPFEPVVEIKNQILKSPFDPFETVSILFETNIKIKSILPKMMNLDQLTINLKNLSLECIFQANKDNEFLKEFNFIQTNLIQMQLNYSQDTKTNYAKFLVKTLVFEFPIELVLEIKWGIKNTFDEQITLCSCEIGKVSFTQIIKYTCPFQFPQSLKFPKDSIQFFLCFEKQNNWLCCPKFSFSKGSLQFLNELFLEDLSFQIICQRDQVWRGRNLTGKCQTKQKQQIGSFEISLNDLKGEISAVVKTNPQFKFSKFLQELLNLDIQNFLDKMHSQNQKVNFQISDKKQQFYVNMESIQNYQFNEENYLKITQLNYNFIAEQLEKQTISKVFKLKFRLNVLETFEEELIYSSQDRFPVLKVEHKSKQQVLRMFQLLKQFQLIELPLLPLFENLLAPIQIIIEFNQNLSFKRFKFFQEFKGNNQYQFLTLKNLSFEYEKTQNNNILKQEFSLIFGIIGCEIKFQQIDLHNDKVAQNRLILEGNSISNFHLNNFIKYFTTYDLSQKLSFSIQIVKGNINIQKEKIVSQFVFEAGEGSFLEYFKLSNLLGQVNIYSEKHKNLAEIKGIFNSNNGLEIGEVKITVNSNIKAEIFPSRNLSMKKLVKNFLNIDLYCIQNNIEGLEVKLFIQDSKFLANQALKNIKIDFPKFLRIKSAADFKFEIVDIKKSLTINFEIECFNKYKKSFELVLYENNQKNYEEEFEETIEVTQMLERMNDYSLISTIPNAQLFENLRLKFTFSVIFFHDLRFDDFQIKANFTQNKQIFPHLSLSKLYFNYKYNDQQFKISGVLKLLQTIELNFIFTDQFQFKLEKSSSVLKYLSIINLDKNQLQIAKDCKILEQEFQSSKVSYDFNNHCLELIWNNQNCQFWLNCQNKEFLTYHKNGLKNFSALSQYFEIIDQWLIINMDNDQKCFIISSQTKWEDNLLISKDWLKLIQKLEQPDSNCIIIGAQIKGQVSGKLKEIFKFLDMHSLNFQAYLDAKEIKFNFQQVITKFELFSNLKCEVSYQLRSQFQKGEKKENRTLELVLALNETTSKNFKLEGIVRISNLSTIQGELRLRYNNAFGFKDFNLEGNLGVYLKKTQLTFKGQVNAEICGTQITVFYRASLITYAWGFAWQNNNVKDFFQTIKLSQVMPEFLLQLIPKNFKAACAFGRFDKRIFEAAKFVCEQSEFLSNMNKEVMKLHDINQKIVILFQSSNDSQSFVVHFYFEWNLPELCLQLKGLIILEYKDLLFKISLNDEISPNKLQLAGDCELKLWGVQIQTKVQLKSGAGEIKFSIQIASRTFNAVLKLNLCSEQFLQIDLTYDKCIGNDESFKIVSFDYLKIGLLLGKQNKLTLSYHFSCFSFDFKNELTLLNFELPEFLTLFYSSLIKLASMLSSSGTKEDQEELIAKNSEEINKLSMDGFRKDLSNELNKIKEKVDERKRKKLEQERLEKERLERERLEKERLERERLENERIEQERLEKKSLEKKRVEQERLEKEILEKKRLEKVILEKEKLVKVILEKGRCGKVISEKGGYGKVILEKDEHEEETPEKQELEIMILEKRRLEELRWQFLKLEIQRLEKVIQITERLEKVIKGNEKFENVILIKQRLQQVIQEKEKSEKVSFQTVISKKGQLKIMILEKERLEQVILERERLEQVILESERFVKAIIIKQKLENVIREKKRLGNMLFEFVLEKDRFEKLRIIKVQLENFILEKERCEKVILKKRMEEKLRLQKVQLITERLEQLILEQKRFKKMLIEKERLEKIILQKERFQIKDRLEKMWSKQQSLEEVVFGFVKLKKQKLQKVKLITQKLETVLLESERSEKMRLIKKRLNEVNQEKERLEKVIFKKGKFERVILEKFEKMILKQKKLEKVILEKERLKQEILEFMKLQKVVVEKEILEKFLLQKKRFDKVKQIKKRFEQVIVQFVRLEKCILKKIRLIIMKVNNERIKKKRLEKERLEKERLEKERLEKERLEKERLEKERLEKERLEKERLEKEKLEKERLEKERLEKERLEKERLEKERLEKERLEKERLEKVISEKVKSEKVKSEKEILEMERLEKVISQTVISEKERLEKERLEKERLEKERLEKERLEKERLEKERLEKERLEKERLEKERLEKERLEKERLEKERLEKERLEKERLEKERLEKEKQMHENNQHIFSIEKEAAQSQTVLIVSDKSTKSQNQIVLFHESKNSQIYNDSTQVVNHQSGKQYREEQIYENDNKKPKTYIIANEQNNAKQKIRIFFDDPEFDKVYSQDIDLSSYDSSIKLAMQAKNQIKKLQAKQEIDQPNLQNQDNSKQIDTQGKSNFNDFYEQILIDAETRLFEQWKDLNESKNIPNLYGCIIIAQQSDNQQQVDMIGNLLIQLQFLHQSYEVILSGQKEAVLLKSIQSSLSQNDLEDILHALNGRTNKVFPKVQINHNTKVDFLILIEDNHKKIARQCRIQLKTEGFQQFFISSDYSFIEIDLKKNEKQTQEITLLQLLLQAQEHKQFQLQNEEQPILASINSFQFEKVQLNPMLLNTLKHLLEVNKFTKYSLSSKGTTIDIKGIIKFYCTNGAAKDLMKQKNRGGVSLYLFHVILDLSLITKDQLTQIILPFLKFLIQFCNEAKIICNLMIYQEEIILIKENFATVWSEEQIETLMQHLNSNSNQHPQQDIEKLKRIFSQLEKFNSYKKYVLLINHQLYNYSNQNYYFIENFAHSRQIKMISFGIGIQKFTNISIQGISHFPLIEKDNYYQLMQHILEKKTFSLPQCQTKISFQVSQQKYPQILKILDYESQIPKEQSYINKHFNYIPKVQIEEPIVPGQMIFIKLLQKLEKSSEKSLQIIKEKRQLSAQKK